jgi:hypothetical protein
MHELWTWKRQQWHYENMVIIATSSDRSNSRKYINYIKKNNGGKNNISNKSNQSDHSTLNNK